MIEGGEAHTSICEALHTLIDVHASLYIYLCSTCSCIPGAIYSPSLGLSGQPAFTEKRSCKFSLEFLCLLSLTCFIFGVVLKYDPL